MIELHIGDDTYEFDDTVLMLSEAIEWQKVTGMTPAEIFSRFNLPHREPEAIRAVVWLARRRAGDKVKYSDVDFDLGKFTITALEASEAEGEGEQSADPSPPAAEPARRGRRSPTK